MTPAVKWILGALLAIGSGGTMLGGMDSIGFGLTELGAGMIVASVIILVGGVCSLESIECPPRTARR